MERCSKRILSAMLLVLLATQAQAHIGQGVVGGFGSGFLYSISGLDPIVGMVAVGL